MTARIYVGTYAKYNDGNLDGEWFDLEDYYDKDEFIEACLARHEDEEDPELMFQDWEDIPDKYISESWLDEDFWDEWLNLDDDDKELLEVYRSEVDREGTLEKARDAYRGKADTAEDFAEQWCYEMGYDIPDWLQNHIDWSSVADEMRHDFTFADFDGEVWVFHD